MLSNLEVMEINEKKMKWMILVAEPNSKTP